MLWSDPFWLDPAEAFFSGPLSVSHWTCVVPHRSSCKNPATQKYST